jgi:hypothetical protein
MNTRKPTLICITPPEYRAALAKTYGAMGIRVRWYPRPETGRVNGNPPSGNDPYGISAFTGKLRGYADALLLVVPRNRSPRCVIPSSVVNGLPIGLVFSNRLPDLEPWLSGLLDQNNGSSTWAILAMWQEYYMNWGKRFINWLNPPTANRVEAWFECEVSRGDLCERLATGPRLVLYFGHGHSAGLIGYYGLRWADFIDTAPEASPCGTVMCFACDTLRRRRGITPFGCEWISGGRAGAFIGCVDSIPVKNNALLAAEIGRVLQKAPDRLDQFLSAVDERIQSGKNMDTVRKTFLSYRVVGNPLQALS